MPVEADVLMLNSDLCCYQGIPYIANIHSQVSCVTGSICAFLFGGSNHTKVTP